jgi:hypothetical protein
MPTPAEADKTGAFYTFEKGATKTAGGQGFADVWWEGRFAWEYKGHRADLKAAYQQLLQYREDLGRRQPLIRQRVRAHDRRPAVARSSCDLWPHRPIDIRRRRSIMGAAREHRTRIVVSIRRLGRHCAWWS